MPRELLIQDWCDLCFTEDKRVEGRPTPPLMPSTISAAKARVLILCDTHWQGMWEPLRVALLDHGQAPDTAPSERPRAKPVKPAARAVKAAGESSGEPDGPRSHKSGTLFPGPFECGVPECDKMRHPAKNMSSFSQHLYKRHRMTITEYRKEYGPPRRPNGTTAPDYGVSAALKASEDGSPLACQEPGCRYRPKGGNLIGSLIAHRRVTHADLWDTEEAESIQGAYLAEHETGELPLAAAR